MRKLLITLLFISVSYLAKTQDFKYGTASVPELTLTKYAKDTSAHAVVLSEFGKSYISTADAGLPLIFEYHVKIKILDSKGIDKANIEIPFYIGTSDHPEEVYDIKGVSSYLDDKNQLRSADLDKNKIFRVVENKYWGTMKFTLPDVHAGSVLEYVYKIKSPYKQNFREWTFQDDIPKVRSEYEAHIPAIYNYNAALRGSLALTSNKSSLDKGCFTLGSTSADCSNISYVMDNVPAFIEEDYMTSPKNFLSAITFELSDYYDFNLATTKKVSVSWTDVDRDLRKDDNFGSYLRRKTMLKSEVTPVIAGITDKLAQAKAIYAHIQKNLKWNNVNSIYTDGPKQALDKHTGKVSDVNMALAIALTSAGLDAEVVLLSTRSNGLVNKLFPVLTEFNYVIVKLNIDDKVYLLDATDSQLPFGMLPMRCLNDQGRVINMEKPSYWIDLNTEQKQSNTYTFDVTLQTNGKLKGTMNFVSRGYSAFERRAAIKKFNTIDEYVEDLDEKLSKIKILKSVVNGIDTLDMPVAEMYEVEIDAYDNMNHERLSFTPFVINRITTNPFKLEERTYPVDWGMPSETRYIFNLRLPDGYVIDNPPQTNSFTMPNNGARFMANFDDHGNSFVMSQVTSFNKSIYNSEEYPYLKEFYNKIILAEKTDVLLKKKP